MKKGVAAFVCLLTVTACDRLQDPVSAAIFTSPKNGFVDVKRSLPASADQALLLLARWGYLPNTALEARASVVQISAEVRHPAFEIYFLPEVARSESARDRKYLMRNFEINHGTEGYGLIFDADANGEVVTAVGFVSFQIVF